MYTFLYISMILKKIENLFCWHIYRYIQYLKNTFLHIDLYENLQFQATGFQFNKTSWEAHDDKEQPKDEGSNGFIQFLFQVQIH